MAQDATNAAAVLHFPSPSEPWLRRQMKVEGRQEAAEPTRMRAACVLSRAVNGPRILKDCGPGLLAKKDLNRSLGPVLQRANIIA